MRKFLRNAGLAALIGLAPLTGCSRDQPEISIEQDAAYSTKPAQIKNVNPYMKSIVFVVDTSGSMGDTINGVQKIQSATEVLAKTWATLNEHHSKHFDLEAGVIDFNNDAAEVLMPLKEFAYEEIKGKLQYLTPKTNTPLGLALVEAERMLDANATGERNIVFLTDGINNVGRDIVPVYAHLNATNKAAGDAKTGLYVISYDVPKGMFKALTDEGATVYEAKDADELAKVFTKTIEILLEK